MDIVNGELIQPFDPATGKLNDSVLSGNVLVSEFEYSNRYVDLPDGGSDRSTYIGNRRPATANCGNTALIGQPGPTINGNGGSGGGVTIKGGHGGTGIGSDKFSGAGGNLSLVGGSAGYPSGGGTAQRGGEVFINGGPNEYGGDFGSVFIGSENTKLVWLAQDPTVRVGFFSANPVLQQSGGSATAGNTYTTTEKQMIQKAYDCLRAFGLLS